MPIPGNLLNATTEQVDPSTAGWRARLNCTKTLGTGGRNGDGTLRLTSSAAGEMQADTVSLVPVAAGQTYFVFADAASSTQAERIGIEWLTTSGAVVGSITWSMTTSAASATWHRVSVAGVCPVGAARARVVLSSTAGAASRLHDWENVYFGAPIRFSGNLFSFNIESGGELDITGWTAEANTTLARSVPVVSWPATWYLSGGHVIGLTATAAGNASMVAAERPPAVPGQEYQAYAYLNPPTSVAQCWVELRWYDAAGVQISAVRATLAQPSTGWYRQYVSGSAPAGTASCSIAAGIVGATAGQTLRVEGVVMTNAPELRAGTVVPYSDASFEQGIGTWATASGPGTIARSTWSSAAGDGAYYLVVTNPSAGTTVVRSGLYPIGDGGGLPWRWQVWAQVSTGTWQIARSVRWYDDLGTEIGASLDTLEAAPTPGWWILSNSDTAAPAGARQAAIEYTLVSSATGVIWLDRVALWQDLPNSVATPDVEHARVTLTQRELTAGQLISVWRSGPDGVRHLVRGADGLLDQVPITSDILIVEDYEAPLGVPLTYWIETYNATTGALTQRRQTDGGTLAVSDRSLMWIKDPGQPQRNLTVQAVTAPDWTRPARQTEHQVRGRKLPVVLSDVRDGLVGEMRVRTRSDEERRALHFALDPDHVMLLQWAPGLGLDDMYVRVGEPVEARVQEYGGDPTRVWTLPVRQVDQPTVGVAGTAGWTVRDVVTEYTTVQDVITAYATVLDLALDNRRT